jgi:hypothetical protein
MKYFVMIAVVALTGCGTLGGAMQGAAQDLNNAGTYIRTIGQE